MRTEHIVVIWSFRIKDEVLGEQNWLRLSNSFPLALPKRCLCYSSSLFVRLWFHIQQLFSHYSILIFPFFSFLGKALFRACGNSWLSSLIFEPAHYKTNKMACAPSEDSDQPEHPTSLISLRFALNG